MNKEIGRKGIGFIGFIYDELKNENKIHSLIYIHKLDWPQMILEKSLKHSLIEEHKVLSYPTFFLIDKTGKIIYRDIGEDGLMRMTEFLKIKGII